MSGNDDNNNNNSDLNENNFFSASEHLEICEKSKNTLFLDSLRRCVEDMRDEIDNSEARHYADMVLEDDEFNIRHVISFYNCVKFFQIEKKQALKKIQKSFLTLQSLLLHAFNLGKTFHIATTVSDDDSDIDDNGDDSDDGGAATKTATRMLLAKATTNLLALAPPKKRQRLPSKLALEAAKPAENINDVLSVD